MRLVHNGHNHHNTPTWVEVANRTIWGHRYREATTGQNTTAPYGCVSIECYRTPQTALTEAGYRLHLEDEHGKQITVQCSQQDLRNLAMDCLEAAQHGYPLELTRAGYAAHVAPWFQKGGA